MDRVQIISAQIAEGGGRQSNSCDSWRALTINWSDCCPATHEVFSDGNQRDMQLKATHGNRNRLNKRLQSTATNNSYAVMEEHLANYKAAAAVQAITDIKSLSHIQTTHSQT